jgi:DNA-directed RNA polymerase subunit omega
MTTESRVRYTSQTAVDMVGNRYDLVLIASARVRELQKGHRPKLETKNARYVTALLEVEAGLVGRDYLKKVRETKQA